MDTHDAIRELVESLVDRKRCSIEIGTPGRGGVVKIYFDPLNLEECYRIIENAYIVYREMQRYEGILR